VDWCRCWSGNERQSVAGQGKGGATGLGKGRGAAKRMNKGWRGRKRVRENIGGRLFMLNL